MANDIKPTDIEPTEIKPTEIEPTKIEPTEIKPTEIKPTEIKPTEIKPTEIRPTDIRPTEIKPTDVMNSQIEPTNINKVGRKAKADLNVFSSKRLVAQLCVALFGAVSFFALVLSLGWSWYFLVTILATVGSLLGVFNELKKFPITQEDLDKWNEEILKKQNKVVKEDVSLNK